MRIISTFLLAAGLATLGACGDGDDNAANNVAADDTLNLAPEDLGTDNLLGNDALGNDTLDTTTNIGADNAADGNTAGNSL